MYLTLLDILALFASAIGIGFVSAIAGVGGGSLLIPFMVLVLNYNVKVAIATSLLCTIVTSSSATSIYLREELVDLKTALVLEPATALGAIVGAHITLTLPANVVKEVLGLILLYVSISMLRGAFRKTPSRRIHVNVSSTRRLLGITASFLAGLVSGMFGIAGGVLKVPLMAVILGLPIKIAAATSSFMVGLTAASGEIVYLIKGLVNPLATVVLASGIIPGALIGARYMERLKPWIVKTVFSSILLYASIRLLYSALM